MGLGIAERRCQKAVSELPAEAEAAVEVTGQSGRQIDIGVRIGGHEIA
jgi:hypothetical protein